MMYDYFRVTGAHDTVLDYADLFSVTLRDDNVQEFDTRWEEVLRSVSKIPSDDVLESMYKLRIRESAQLKTVLELYEMEIHQKISMPNYQKLFATTFGLMALQVACQSIETLTTAPPCVQDTFLNLVCLHVRTTSDKPRGKCCAATFSITTCTKSFLAVHPSLIRISKAKRYKPTGQFIQAVTMLPRFSSLQGSHLHCGQ